MTPVQRSTEPTALIVGAGLTGLVAAAALPDLGHRIALVDKGRSVGGRLATRRIADGRADHGAQFFTVRDPAFRRLTDQWLADGLVFQWGSGWSDGSTIAQPGDGHPRYAVRDGMTALAKHLAGRVGASGATVHVGVRIAAISRTDHNWWAASDDGRVYQGRFLALTCPVPQALALLDEGGVVLAEDDRAALSAIRYAPSLCVLAAVDGETTLPEPGAVQQPGADVAWIADNQRKGISPQRRVLTLHASPDLSRRLYDAADDAVLAAMLPALEPWRGDGFALAETQVKRWRYALPERIHPQPLLAATGLPGLYFGGDAFGGPRVEGAALSGLALADALRAEFDAAGVRG